MTGWRKEAEKVKMPVAFAQVLKLLIDGPRVWLLRAYLKEGQIWECYENQRLIGKARLPFSSETHLIRDGFVVLNDPAQEIPFTIYALEKKESL